MAESFESLVRPNVIPRIRPGGPHTVTDDVGGNAVIGGSSNAQVIKLTRSEQSSWSRSRPTETERVVDRQRIKQKNPDGTINEENYVDVDTAKEITTRGGDGVDTTTYYLKPGEEPNIETIEANVTIKNPEAPSSESGGAAP